MAEASGTFQMILFFKLHEGSSIRNTDIIDIIEDIDIRDICWLKHEQIIRNSRSEISLFILIVHIRLSFL